MEDLYNFIPSLEVKSTGAGLASAGDSEKTKAWASMRWGGFMFAMF